MSQKADLPTALVGGGGALLFVSLFLDWFGGAGEAVSAWTLFESLDIALALLALIALAIAGGRMDAFWSTARTALPVLAGLALLVVAVQLIDPPLIAAEADREVGAWLALVATLLMAAGAAMPFVKLDVGMRETRRRGPAADRRQDPLDPEPEPLDRRPDPADRPARLLDEDRRTEPLPADRRPDPPTAEHDRLP